MTILQSVCNANHLPLSLRDAVTITVCNVSMHRLASYISKENPSLINDQMAIFKQLRNGDITESDRYFESLHNAAVDALGSIDISTSSPLHRLYASDNSLKFKDDAARFYWDLLDSLFVFFVHSYDLGYKLPSNWKQQINDDDAANDDENVNGVEDDEKDEKDGAQDIADDDIQKLKSYLWNQQSILEKALPDLKQKDKALDKEDANYDRLVLFAFYLFVLFMLRLMR